MPNYAVRAQDVEVSWDATAGADATQLTARYMPLTVGSYSVAVSYRGSHIKGSPATRSELLGLPSHLTAGDPFTLQVVAKDAFGNLSAGKDVVAVIVDSALEGKTPFNAGFATSVHITSSVEESAYRQARDACAGITHLPVKDLGGGTYAAMLRSTKAGMLTVFATVNGESVGLPTTVGVKAGPLVSLAACSSSTLHCTAGILMTPILSHSRLFCAQWPQSTTGNNS